MGKGTVVVLVLLGVAAVGGGVYLLASRTPSATGGMKSPATTKGAGESSAQTSDVVKSISDTIGKIADAFGGMAKSGGDGG
jgi:hypothetical protein